jgi:glycosyltransferase involved in cell wall biosynthesis
MFKVFLGCIEDTLKPLLYNATDVTVTPSYSEGAPLVIPESLACGTPVVATDVGGNLESWRWQVSMIY